MTVKIMTTKTMTKKTIKTTTKTLTKKTMKAKITTTETTTTETTTTETTTTTTKTTTTNTTTRQEKRELNNGKSWQFRTLTMFSWIIPSPKTADTQYNNKLRMRFFKNRATAFWSPQFFSSPCHASSFYGLRLMVSQTLIRVC